MQYAIIFERSITSFTRYNCRSKSCLTLLSEEQLVLLVTVFAHELTFGSALRPARQPSSRLTRLQSRLACGGEFEPQMRSF